MYNFKGDMPTKFCLTTFTFRSCHIQNYIIEFGTTLRIGKNIVHEISLSGSKTVSKIHFLRPFEGLFVGHSALSNWTSTSVMKLCTGQ